MKRCATLLAMLCGCTFDAPHLPNLDAADAFAHEVDGAALLPWVEQLAADHASDDKLSCDGYETIDKYPACQLSNASAIELVHDRLTTLGYRVRRLDQKGATPDVAHNLVAELRGSTHPAEVVLIGAHLDAFYAGADDDSSGVAALLELARIAAKHRFARTLRFVAFDLEERGAAGSARYVAEGHADDVVAALILECIGYTDRKPGSQDAPPGFQLGDTGDALLIGANADSRSIAQRMLALNAELDFLPLRAAVAGGSGAYPLTGALLRSDNGPFWLRGLPAVMLTDTANYRNPRYHEAGDTAGTLDPAFLAASTRLTAASLAVLAELEP